MIAIIVPCRILRSKLGIRLYLSRTEPEQQILHLILIVNRSDLIFLTHLMAFDRRYYLYPKHHRGSTYPIQRE